MPKSSDPIVQSLENATDSRDFELLCSDILAGTVYPGIEPIGGTGDGGRDALYRDAVEDNITVCAFSLRQDWETKLRLDCERVNSLQHECNRFLFATSMQPTPAARDMAVKKVRDDFGWSLELYGRERLATAIRGRLEHLLERHPGIFRKAQFRLAGGRLLETSRRDLLLIDHVDRDQGFAQWIGRCLRLVGYDVWCRGTDSTSGEVADTAIRDLLENRARHHLPVFSETSVSDPEFRGRVEQSAAADRRLLPLRMETVNLAAFSSRVRRIDPVPFEHQRARGVRLLNSKLEEWDAPKDHEVTRRRRDGLRLPIPSDFVRHEPETLFSNVFPIKTVPKVVQEWRLLRKWNEVQIQTARRAWAFVKSGDHMYSFMRPPDNLQDSIVALPGEGSAWRYVTPDHYDGKNGRDIVSELLRRTLEFSFYRVGLLWCPDRNLIYFNPKKLDGKRLSLIYPNGGGTTRAVCGQKHKWRPNGKGEDYNWQLAPDCRCYGSYRDPWEFRSRVMIRVTYRDGRPIEPKRVITFRRHAANGWNQDKFRDLNLLVMQHAAPGEPEITVGTGRERVTICTEPRIFESPLSVDESAMPKGASRFSKRVRRADDNLDESEFDD